MTTVSKDNAADGSTNGRRGMVRTLNDTRVQGDPVSRKDYNSYFGPTDANRPDESAAPNRADRVRLGDSDLLIEVEADYCRHGADLKGGSGEELVFGGGKVMRESMGQSAIPRAGETRSYRDGKGASFEIEFLPPDILITGALILDWWGIVKADVAIRGGKIVAFGKAGNPDIMDFGTGWGAAMANPLSWYEHPDGSGGDRRRRHAQ